ncbi:CLUMA_CG006725, isoform A [Clunio marinus]|uniref:CLUMA_CG006725, isoform A n=1 Tax=Clunio marinus TaxID=568069 RepID=A0A1J1HYS9_9DIPT|nr:CLUMA_CG006725, isoform A [Clunio marinus]
MTSTFLFSTRLNGNQFQDEHRGDTLGGLSDNNHYDDDDDDDASHRNANNAITTKAKVEISVYLKLLFIRIIN